MTPRLVSTLLAVILLATGCQRAPEKAADERPEPTASTATPAPEGTTHKTTENDDDDDDDDERGADPRRIVAIGDVHGDLEATREALELAGVLGDDDHWAGANTILVQTGDVLDRGDDEPDIMALLERLRDEAPERGGQVVLLNGNHELMNAAGDLRYVTGDGFADYADTPADGIPNLDQVPHAARGRVAAFAPGGPVAQRLATRPVIAVVDGNVFVHGGVLPEHVDYGIDRINQETAAWLQGTGPMPEILATPDSPVWSRHYSDDPDADDCSLLEQTLAALDAERMIVGHTVQLDGITSACNDKVWMIDTGMASHYGGQPHALEIVGDTVNKL